MFKKCQGRHFDKEPGDSIGHVGVYVNYGTVVHAVNSTRAVKAVSIKEFLEDGDDFRGAYRIIRDPSRTATFIVPQELEIETSDDVKRLIFSHL